MVGMAVHAQYCERRLVSWKSHAHHAQCREKSHSPAAHGRLAPGFIATHLQDWLKRVGIKPIQIYPGSPWENGYNERFNGILREEVLNAE